MLRIFMGDEKKMFYLLTLFVFYLFILFYLFFIFYFFLSFSLLMGESVWGLCSPIDRCRLSALLDLSAPQTNGLMMGLDPTLLLAQSLSSPKSPAQVVQCYPPHEPVNDKREKGNKVFFLSRCRLLFVCSI